MGAAFPDVPAGFAVLGGAWVASNGHGLWGDGRTPLFSGTIAELPDAKELVDVPPSRHGRFDAFTKTAFAVVAMALRHAGFEPDGRLKPVGLVLSSPRGCLETDLEFQRGGFPDASLASPQLFSYTLPGVALGECAVAFGLTGPTLSVGDEGRGEAAVKIACELLREGGLEACVAGWLDARRGAAALTLRGTI